MLKLIIRKANKIGHSGSITRGETHTLKRHRSWLIHICFLKGRGQLFGIVRHIKVFGKHVFG